MQIVENKALLLKLRHPERVLATIPRSKQLADGTVLVYWGLDESQVLKNLGVKKVPSPIEKHYNWPGIYTPFAHQRTTASFLTLHRRAYCFNDPGTAKTASVAWAADYLLRTGHVRRVLVICPLSIMNSAWRADLFKTVMHRRVDIAHGSREKRTKVIQSDAEFVIINFDGVETVLPDLKDSGFDLVIIDEANAVKTATTKRWRAINSLIQPNTWLWMLTGTPASQSPTDAYGLAKMMDPGSIPSNFYTFRDRVMYKLTQFRWKPKTDAAETINKILQPAIRFTKDECLDLPELLYTTREAPLTPQQSKYYKLLKEQFIMTAAGETVTSVNAATNLNKLLQVACISYNTDVLTDVGWLPIQLVTPQHRVWDGVEWVAQQGAIFRGVKPLVTVAGVRMTADHKVLTNDGWATADDILKPRATGAGLDWAEVRLPGGISASRVNGARKSVREVGVSMRLRGGCGEAEPISSQYEEGAPKELWLPSRERNAQNDAISPVPRMVRYAAEMFRPKRQRLPKLRSTGDNCLQTLGRVVCEFLGRHAGRVRRWFGVRSDKREWPVQSRELSMGYGYGASQQYAVQPVGGYTKGPFDGNTGGGSLRYKESDATCATVSVQLAARESAHYAGTERVYDLVNCGPRSRFVVRGATGTPLIVHNCGAVYTDDGNTVVFDMTHRYNVLLEAIEESTHKVLVFVPFRHAIDHLENQLKKDGYTVEVVHGGVAAHKRTEIFKAFQTGPDPRILLIQPAAASHGVTLHAANTVVWWGPVTSNEIWHQANARVHRAGQKNPCLVVKLCGSPVERKQYEALESKTASLDSLLNLYKEVLDA